jgi:glycosyltransferase involved in cell wall biosynthesis
MSIRILMLTHQRAGLGGSFMRAFSMAHSLVGMGYDVTLLASRAESGWGSIKEDWGGVHILQLRDIFPAHLRNAGLSPLDLSGRLAHINHESYDIIHAFDHRPSSAWPALLRPDKGVPFVSDWADLWGDGGLASQRTGISKLVLSSFDSYFEPFTRRHCDAVTAISQELIRRATALGLPSERVVLVGVGAQADRIYPLDPVTYRPDYGIPPNAKVLVYCGFAGHDFELIEQAFIPLAQRHPNVHLLMTGKTIGDFEELVVKNDVEKQVHILGIVPYEKLGEVLACGDVMLLPYGRNMVNIARFPNRFGEYIAAGRAILTNAVGELGEVVMREGIGLATAPEPQAFAHGMEELLNDPERCAEMGARARQLAETRYSWRRWADEVDELYKALLK